MGAKEPAAPAKPLVAVSILPQAYFVERIAGGIVEPLVIVGPGQSPHSYEPTPRQMAELSRAAAWFSLGVEFERALGPKLASLYPSMRVVDTTVGVRFRTLEAHHHDGEDDEDHDEAEEHGEGDGGLDPHIWLGRDSVKAQAAAIRDGLSALYPEHAPAFSANYNDFSKELDELFDALKRELAALRGTPAFVFHPAFGYFFDEFGIRQEAVETGGKEPTQKALAELIAKAKAEGAKVVFVQAQFPSNAATAVAAAIGGQVVSIDPLARDWMDNLRRMAEALRKASR